MADLDQTFDPLWLQTGLADLGLDAPHDQTIRPALHATRGPGGLPHLSIGEADGEDRLPDGVQLVVRELLGEGGMGQVHVARQPLLDRDVAIKRVKGQGSAAAHAGLYREARYMGSLEHPNIIPVHALGADDRGSPILVMKRIVGTEWRTLIAEPDHEAWSGWNGMAAGVLPRNVEILINVCRAVQFAHEKGVLHRDLKPENVMIGDHGSVYVLDWGIAARVTCETTSLLVGTPSYMPPEMVDVTAPLSPATDVYLLGACLHEVLTGRPPHQGGSLREVLAVAHASVPPQFGPDVPADLGEICARCLAADPAERPATVAALSELLVEWIRNRGSAELAQRAREALERMDGILAAEVPNPQDVAAAFSECRFGFRQALDSWPENQPARDGLQQGLRAMIAFEISRENLDHARGLLTEVADPGTLGDALTAAESRIQAQRALASDLDLGVSGAQRAAFISSLGCVGLLISGAVLGGFVGDLADFGTDDMIVVGLGFYTVLVTLVAVGRRWLFRNAVNTGITVAVLSVAGAVLIERIAAYLGGMTPAQAFSSDLILMGSALAVLAGFIRDPGMVVGAVGAALGSLACAVWPAHAMQIFSGVTSSGFFAGGAYWYWTTRQ